MRFSTRSPYFDWSVIGLSLIMMLASSVAFSRYDEWILEPRVSQRMTREKAGDTLLVQNDGRRRYLGSPMYFGLKDGKPIFIKDTIFVEKGAVVDIQMGQGSTIRLHGLTLVYILRDGDELVLAVQDGLVTGRMQKGDKLKFQVQEEVFDLEGETGAEFWLAVLPSMPPFLSSLKGRTQVTHRGQKRDLTDQTMDIGEKAEVRPRDDNANRKSEFDEDSSTDQGPAQDQAASPAPREIKPRVPGLDFDPQPVTPEEVRIDLATPYPVLDALFLRRKDASILLLPARGCTHDCSLTIAHQGIELDRKLFKAGQMPAMKVSLKKEFSGSVNWKLQDGEDVITGSFSIRDYSSEAFAEGIRSGRPIEILD